MRVWLSKIAAACVEMPHAYPSCHAEVSAPGENKYVINLRKRAVTFGSNKVLRQLRREARSLQLPPHTLELFNKGRDLLKYRLLLGQELRVQWAHLGQNSIELCAVLAGKFPLE